ncbi:MAG TPA: hypothetical protein VFC98_00900 [Clostridia bacterium]|nr:hypothetical protein [Clostridia bacterium]
MKHLEDILEEIKQLGNYSVMVAYGEETGCDDLDIPQNKRNIRIFMNPMGVLGSVRVMWKGNLPALREFDFTTKPETVGNPPSPKEVRQQGYYVWGTKQGLAWLFEKWDDRHGNQK